MQMQRVGNFRDQLNKNMLETVAKDKEPIIEDYSQNKESEKKPKNLEPPKKYKVPPRIIKPEPEIDKEQLLENFSQVTRPVDVFTTEKSPETEEVIEGHSNIRREHKHQDLDNNNNDKNISFSEENCISVYSDNKESKHQVSNQASQSSSADKNINNSKQEKDVDAFYTLPINPNENQIKSGDHAIQAPTNILQINKLQALGNNPPKSKVVSTNPRSHSKNETAPNQIQINIAQKNNELSQSNHLKEEITLREKKEELVIIAHKVNESEKDKSSILQQDNEVENFSELLRKLDVLKNEIRELKNSKTTIQTNLEVELNKNKIYQNEIEQLRKNLNAFKTKELKEGEAMLKLEIQGLNDTVSYHEKINELLKKENESLKQEVNKLQEYITDLIEIKNKNKQESYPLREQENRLEDVNELNEPLVQHEYSQHEEITEQFDEDVKNSIMPLEPFEEEQRENIQEDDVPKDEEPETVNQDLSAEEYIQQNLIETNEIQPTDEFNTQIPFENVENNEPQYENYSLESNINLPHEQNIVMLSSDEPTVQKNNEANKSIESKGQIKLEKQAQNLFYDISYNRLEEDLFNKQDKEKSEIPEKKESNVSAVINKTKDSFTPEKKTFHTPQNRMENNIFNLTSDLHDDVFSSVSQDNINPAPFKKVEKTNINRKQNPVISRPQHFPQSIKEKNNTKLTNLQFNADDDIGSIFGSLTRNEIKGNSLFD